MSSRSFSVLFFALALCFGSLTAQGQSSTPTSPPPAIPLSLSEPLWQTLLPLITGLPTSFQSFKDNLTSQVSFLQQTMLSLQSSSAIFRADNESLTASLAISQGLESTLENRSTQLQKALDASMLSTIQVQADLRKAQGEAKALEAQVSVFRIGCITLGVGLGAVAVYEGGHALKLW
jgi:hypothetical protein